jgi:hypothetical protein
MDIKSLITFILGYKLFAKVQVAIDRLKAEKNSQGIKPGTFA